jgi:hypothetical protein
MDEGEMAILRYSKPLEAAKTFFINCYHFKDWLKASKGQFDNKDIEKYVEVNPYLRKAGIICNALKHTGTSRKNSRNEVLADINLACKIDIPILQGGKAFVTAEQNPHDGDTIEILTTTKSMKKGKAISKYKVFITLGKEKYDALDLALGCMAAWDEYLKMHGITISP